jgi:transmembrane sensor
MSDRTPSVIHELLAKHWSGEATEHDTAQLGVWTAEEPARQEQVEALHGLWLSHRTPVAAVDTESALARIRSAVRTDDPYQHVGVTSPPLQRHAIKHAPRRSASRWTALLIASAAVVLGAFATRSWWNPAGDKASASAGEQYVTGRGQRATISLADGSTMVLAPESRAHVTFTSAERRLTLEGHAYFTIARRTSAPFTVSTHDGDVRVLGTRFTVRRYATETATHVAVLDGRVGVGPAVLGARDAATMTARVVRKTSETDTTAAMSWTTGRLVFRDAPLRDVLAELGRWYDVDFVLGDSSRAHVRITTNIGGATLTDATMRSLALLIDARAIRRGRTITFTVAHP